MKETTFFKKSTTLKVWNLWLRWLIGKWGKRMKRSFFMPDWVQFLLKRCRLIPIFYPQKDKCIGQKIHFWGKDASLLFLLIAMSVKQSAWLDVFACLTVVLQFSEKWFWSSSNIAKNLDKAFWQTAIQHNSRSKKILEFCPIFRSVLNKASSCLL